MNRKFVDVMVAAGLLLWLTPVVNLLLIVFCYAVGIPCWSVTEEQAIVSVVWFFLGSFGFFLLESLYQ